jgi:hypothetical protein
MPCIQCYSNCVAKQAQHRGINSCACMAQCAGNARGTGRGGGHSGVASGSHTKLGSLGGHGAGLFPGSPASRLQSDQRQCCPASGFAHQSWCWVRGDCPSPCTECHCGPPQSKTRCEPEGPPIQGKVGDGQAVERARKDMLECPGGLQTNLLKARLPLDKKHGIREMRRKSLRILPPSPIRTGWHLRNLPHVLG